MAVNYDEIISDTAPVKPMQPMAPPSSANKYDDIIAEDQSQGAATLKETMYAATAKNPEEHAKALDLSKKTGVPADLIDQDTLPDVQEAAASNGVDYEKIHNKNPRVSNFLMNPDNAAVTHDDVPAMKKIDNTVEEYGWMQTILRGMAQGVNQIGSQASKVPAFMYDLWAYDASRGGETAPKILGLETGLPLQAPQSWRQNPVTDFFDSNSKYWEMPKLDKADLFDDIQDGNYRRAGIKLAHDVATSAPQSLALLAAAVSGFGIPALVGAGALSAADKKDQLQKQGEEGGEGADAAADPGRSLLNASLTGTFEAATEAIPMGALHHYSSAIYKSFGKQATKEVMLDFSKAIFGSAASEGIEETVNSFANDLTDWATGTNPNFDVAASTKRAMNAGVVGMASGGLMTGPSAIMAGAHRMTQERTAHHASEFYIEVGDQLDQTKVNERSTDVKKALVHELTTGTDAEAVYVNPKDFATYFQSKNESPSKIAADLGVSREYDNAVETGNDLKVPMAKWAEVLHGTDHYVGLKNDIKFDPEMQSVNELKESQAAHQEEMQKIDEQAKADADAAPKFDIAAPMREQLVATGRFTDQEAQLAADHHARMIEGLSRQTGIAPEEILKMYPLNVGDGSSLGPQMVDGQMVLNQDPNNPNATNPNPLGFYSQLEHEVSKMDFKQMPAKDLSGRLKNVAGLKPEEVELTGLNEFLDHAATENRKVTKEEVMQFLKEKGVKVEQIVKAKDFGGDTGTMAGEIEWDDESRDTGGNSDDISSEMDYYIDDPEQAFGDDLATWRAEFEKEHTDEDGNVDEAAVTEALDEKIRDEAETRATEYVESDDYHGARFTVESNIRNTTTRYGGYYSLHGSDEIGWYSHDFNKEFGGNIEEAKIQLAAHLLDEGIIEGDRSQLIKSNEIEWKKPTAAKHPAQATITKRANEILKNDKARLEAKVKEDDPWRFDDVDGKIDFTTKANKKHLKDGIESMAREEAREYYNDPTNPKNTVSVSIDHGILEGHIEGNDTKGYTLKYESQKVSNNIHDLEAKTLEEAKKEAIAKIVANGDAVEVKTAEQGADPNAPTGKTKWDKYTVPGGQNHREILLTLPQMPGGGEFEYRTHYDEKNILAHIRISDRVDAQGRKTLFIEEMQSDLHQQGREKGYRSPDIKISDLKDQRAELEEQMSAITEETRKATNAAMKQAKQTHPDDVQAEYRRLTEEPEFSKAFDERGKLHDELDAKRKELTDKINAEQEAVPNAPFKNTDAWTALALKRMLRLATEQGYEVLSWSPAAVHVDRWGTDSISWLKREAIDTSKWKVKKSLHNSKTFDVVDENGKTRDTSFQNKEAAENWIKGQADLVGKPHWLIGSAEQEGGNADGVNIEELARARGQLLERNGEVVSDKAELRKQIAETLGREKKDRSLDALTERVWKEMSAEGNTTGGIKPRAEGMGFFYDKMIPDVAKKLLKKMDPNAKIEVGAINTDSDLTHEDVKNGTEFDPDQSMKVLEIPITEAMKAKAQEGFTLFQPGTEDGGGEGPRGQINIGKDGKFTINFFKTADLSTAIHELSHFHFEVLGRLAQDEKAHASVKDDYAKILNWLGVTSKEEITVEHHEKFARGVEAYLMEGKAPVPELRSAFARIKAWMLHIYKDIRNLKIELNPEIRSVFDRLVAAEDQVKAAQHQQNQEPLFNQENAAKFLGAGADRYFEAAQEVKDFAEGKVTQKLMNDFNKAKSEIYQDKRKEVRASVEAEVNEERVYKTIDILQKGKLEDLTGTEQHIPDGAKRLTNIKLDKADLIAMIGAAEFEKIKNMKGTYIYSRLNGVHPDIAAILLGYSSGHQMIREILKAPDKTSVIEERTNKRMADLFPDSFLNGTLPEEAIEAVHNEKRSQILRMELDALVKNHPAVFKDVLRRITRRVPSDAEVKANAIKIVGSKSVGDVRPHIYALAERKSAKLAGEALAKGDVPLAIEHKLKELLNHEMYRAAIDAKEYIEKQFKQFKKIGRSDEAISKTRDTDIVNAARAILARFGIGKSGKTAESYLETMKREDADTYNSMMVLVNDATQKVGNYKDISFDDFHAMADAVGAMWDLAKSSREITIDGKKMDRDLAIGDLSNRLSDIITNPTKPGYHEAVTDAEKRGMLISGALASMKRTEHWADTVDGLAKGPFRKYIWNPISEAVTKYRLEKSKVISEYEKIIKEIAPRITREKIHSDELGYTFKDKAELLMAVLHSGNDSNLDKLLRGRNWGSINEDGTLDRSRWDKFIARMQAEKVLGKAEYDFAQKIWDLMESMKSGAQKAHKEMYGYYFNEITANKITTPFGEYRGGYVPAKVDVFTNEDAQIRNEREAFEKNNNSYQFPTTGRGFSKERVQQYAAPLSLELSLLAGHIDGVQRFTHIEPRIKEVSRIVMNKDFRAQLAQLDPSIAKDMLIPWLQRAAQQQVVLPAESGIGRMLDKGARYMRNTVAMQVMVGNIVNTLQQFTGLSVALTKVSAKHMRQGLVSYMTDTKNTVAVMLEKSDYMKSTQGSNIYETQQAIHDIIVNPTKIQKAQDFAKKHTYILQSMTQNVVNTITWTGAYNQAVANGELEAEAVRSADSAVRLTQGTNAPEDISRFETGTATARMFTQFAGYFNMLANVSSGEMTKTVRELGFKKGAGRLFYVYATAIMIPAVISEMMVRAAAGKGLDEDDDDSYVDDLLSIFFGSQFRTVTAMIPHLGGVINAALGGFTQNRFDDRMNIAPAITFIENMAATPGEIYKGIQDEGEFKKKTVKDALMLMGILSSLPIGPLGKPIGYQMDVNSGAANPSGAVDYTRGLITGRPGKQ